MGDIQHGPVRLGPDARAALRPLDGARIDGGFWARRQRANRAVSLPDGAAQLERALPPASFALWERLTQADEIAQAGLTGLTECPFCDWKCVLEEDGEGMDEGDTGRFWCGNRDKCGVISCRKCKKSDHYPKTCEGASYLLCLFLRDWWTGVAVTVLEGGGAGELNACKCFIFGTDYCCYTEAEADKHLDGRHTIEEAMSKWAAHTKNSTDDQHSGRADAQLPKVQEGIH